MSLLTVCTKALRQIGGFEVPSTFYNNNNPTSRLCVALIDQEGATLERMYRWRELISEHTITTVADEDEYALPSDFRAFANDSQWDRTNNLRLYGPASNRDWQFFKSSSIGSSTIDRRFKMRGTKIVINPTPTVTGDEIVFDYYSKNWVARSGAIPVTVGGLECSVGGTANAITLTPSATVRAYATGLTLNFVATSNNTAAPTVNVSSLGAKSIAGAGAGALQRNYRIVITYNGSDFTLISATPIGDEIGTIDYASEVSSDADTFLLDEAILVMGLKWRFLQAKGMPYEPEYKEYESVLEEVRADNGGRRTITLGGPRAVDMLSGMPDTGFGS